jgi:hypothetical protein
VVYSDYGNSEYVPPERLRTKLMFTDIPLQCFECELKGIVTVGVMVMSPALDYVLV